MRKSKASHEERAHAPLPPSASSRWLACAPSMGYVKHLIKRGVITKRKSGAAAERGTRIHELAEPAIVKMIETGVAPRMPKGAAVDEWSEALMYVKHCHDLWQNAVDVDDDAEYGVELKAIVTDECWGSADFWVYAAKRLTVVDLKTGQETVYAKDNTQLLIYALGVIRTKLRDRTIREVEAMVYQPNGHGHEVPYDSHVYSERELTAHSRAIVSGIKEAVMFLEDAEDADSYTARMNAGSHCTWCDALAVCPSAKRAALTTISAGFEPVPVTSPLPDPASLEAEQVAQILERAPMFSAWLEAVQVRAIELAQRGKEIPGFKVVQKMTRRAWGKEHEPAVIAKRLGLKVADLFTEPRMRSPSQVEQSLKGEAKKRVNEFTFKPVGDPTIAPESDRRQAIASSKINFVPVTNSEDD